jgi:hypothetical protein
VLLLLLLLSCSSAAAGNTTHPWPSWRPFSLVLLLCCTILPWPSK